MPSVSYELLQPLTVPPEPFSIGGPTDLWRDPHVQRQMFDHHLDPPTEAASRNHAFIERSVAWLIDTVGIHKDTRVLDLGCGPGLYANPLADVAAAVHGIDLNPVSIAAARRQSTSDDATFAVGDYLHDPLPTHDVALLVYCDYCAMSPDAREKLLDRIRERMTTEGRLVFDVHSQNVLGELDEVCALTSHPNGGFWAPDDHVVLHQRILYEEIRVTLDRNEIAEPSRRRTIHDSLSYFTRDQLMRELADLGFAVKELYSDAAGSTYHAASPNSPSSPQCQPEHLRETNEATRRAYTLVKAQGEPDDGTGAWPRQHRAPAATATGTTATSVTRSTGTIWSRSCSRFGRSGCQPGAAR